MSTIIVTGGSGFIGTNLIQSLLRDGHEVLNLDLRPPACATHGALWKRVDITDRAELIAHFTAFQPEYVYHLAARTDMHGSAVSEYLANTSGTANLIVAAAAVSGRLRRVIFASSRMVCPIGYQPGSPLDYRPPNPYGESKVIGEQMVRAASLACEWVLVRPTSIWGPWFSVPYRDFFDAVSRGRYVHPRGQRIRKSFGFVGNTVFQLRRLMQAPAEAVHGQTFYLADFEPIEVLEWGGVIARAFGVPAIREVPLHLLRIAARAGDLMQALGWKDAPLTSFRLDNLLTQMLYDTGSLEAVCGPLPYRVEDAVPLTVAWMRADRRTNTPFGSDNGN